MVRRDADRLQSGLGHRLLQLGVVLFLLGLLTGFVTPMMENPRMGLASHVQGVINGMLLVLLGLLWSRLLLGRMALLVLFWLALYGTFANWLATLLAAWWGAGRLMPIAAAGFEGTPGQEAVVAFLLLSLSLALVAACALLLWGLRRPQAA